MSEELWAALSIGAVVKGQVHERKDYGVLCDLAAHPDVVGLVMPEQVIRLRCSISLQLPVACCQYWRVAFCSATSW